MLNASKFTHPLLFALGTGLLLVACGPQNGDQQGTEVSERIELEISSAPTADNPGDVEAFLDSLPEAEVPALNEQTATALVALPLSCLDRIHSNSSEESYLYRESAELRPTYEDSLAFYGCYDWHSAVNSTWAMVRLHKEFPELYVGELIRQKLDNHLSEGSMEGEHHYFKEVASAGFERPYGWAWLMKLYTELATWDREEAQTWAENVKPLTELFAERTIEYLNNLAYPRRTGVHQNTAFSFSFMLEYAALTENDRLQEAVTRRAKDFFLSDVDCPLRYEPSGSSFLSPCLAQAELMSRILTPDSYAEWLNTFLPPVNTSRFARLTEPVEGGGGYLEDLVAEDSEEASAEDEEGDDDEGDLKGAESHLIGLTFHRADALYTIANALPEDDARREAYTKVAQLNAKRGFDAMFNADYMGTHWLGTYAVMALVD